MVWSFSAIYILRVSISARWILTLYWRWLISMVLWLISLIYKFLSRWSFSNLLDISELIESISSFFELDSCSNSYSSLSFSLTKLFRDSISLW